MPVACPVAAQNGDSALDPRPGARVVQGVCCPLMEPISHGKTAAGRYSRVMPLLEARRRFTMLVPDGWTATELDGAYELVPKSHDGAVNITSYKRRGGPIGHDEAAELVTGFVDGTGTTEPVEIKVLREGKAQHRAVTKFTVNADGVTTAWLVFRGPLAAPSRDVLVQRAAWRAGLRRGGADVRVDLPATEALVPSPILSASACSTTRGPHPDSPQRRGARSKTPAIGWKRSTSATASIPSSTAGSIAHRLHANEPCCFSSTRSVSLTRRRFVI